MSDDLMLRCCHEPSDALRVNEGKDGALFVYCTGLVTLDHDAEEKLRQFLYRRHRRLVGARKARSPQTPDHRPPAASVINPNPALKQALKTLLEDVE